MIEYGPNGARAEFSGDKRHRFTLRRELEPTDNTPEGGKRCVFVMLNPSTADAFILDPTVARCCKFARRWGCTVLDVVNLYSLRSTAPIGLYRVQTREERGDDFANDQAIDTACVDADIVVAAWGTHGHDQKLARPRPFGGFITRGDTVRERLEGNGVELHYLKLTMHGAPIHPLARGKSYVFYDVAPVRWI